MVAKTVIDAVRQGQAVTEPLVLLFALVTSGALLAAAGSYAVDRTGEGVVLTARLNLSERLMRLRVAELEKSAPGDLIARVASDTDLLRSACTRAPVDAFLGLIVLISALVLMGFLDPVLLAVTVAVLVVVGGASLLVVSRISPATAQAQAAIGILASSLERVLGAYRTMKASGAEHRETDRVASAARRVWRKGVDVAGYRAITDVSVDLAVQLSFLAVLGVGGARVATGALPVSSLVAYLLYLFYLTQPIGGLFQAMTQWQAGSAAALRIGDVDMLAVEHDGRPAGSNGAVFTPAASTAPASVTFDRVSFRYPGSIRTVHDEVTFHVPPGTITAIVGASGAGKSTVFALLERFYTPESGAIYVAGRSLETWPLVELRASMGYVEQECPIMAGTLRENLSYAAPDAGESDIRMALSVAHLNGLLDRIPGGLDGIIGHRGNTLSGGERQRIALARAFLRRPSLLLLDEATSQLDAENERLMRAAVADVGQTTTVIVIAHRLSTVVDADQIILFDRGRVRAAGKHTDLLRRDRLYGSFAATQLLPADTASP